MILTKNIKQLGYLLIVLALIGCKKTDWKETYKEKSKEPFGLYILHNEFEELTGNKKTDLKKNFLDFVYEDYYEDPDKKASYFCVKNSSYKLNNEGIDKLLSFVHSGNVAFLSCNYFPYHLEQKLNFSSTEHLKDSLNFEERFKKSKISLRLTNNNFKGQSYEYSGYAKKNYFKIVNRNTSIVLGSSIIEGENKPNFIKIYHGSGAFYLHNNPVTFSNYYLLEGKEKYVENILSYLPDGEVYWDPQIKSSKNHKRKDREQSIFTFFLQHKTLTWFLLVSLIGLLLFMLFNARRKQRAIPVIKPLENSTVAFTQTISSLYLKEGDHKNLTNKKIKFFLEQVRTKYLLETNNLNAKFIENLALKSGNDIQKTKYLIHSIISINNKTECSEEELIVIYRMIENFFKK